MKNPDVLIAGAGPTGLMLACELARAGVRSFRIVEKLAERSLRSRALVVHARTLEHLQKLGVDGDFVAAGRKTLAAHVYVNREHGADFHIADTGVDDTPFPFLLFVSQAETERLLLAYLEKLGVVIERGVEVASVDPQSAAVTLRAGSREERVEPRFVVGCDGAHSVVRHAGKFAFEGEPYEQDFVLADVRLKEATTDLHLFFDDRGVFALLPLANDAYRIISTRADAPDKTSEPTLDEVQALTDTFTDARYALRDPIWLARFRLHHRQADSYRRDRLFLAGDAAHIHSPAGGQGMNTGMQDAVNLAWKLALVCRGEANERLLDSYSEERHPIGKLVLRTTDRLFSLNTTAGGWAKALRNFAVKYIGPRMLASRERRAWLFRNIAELKVGYPQSSIVLGRAGGPRPGARAPDAPLDGGETVFSITREPAHHLLVIAERSSARDAFVAKSQRAWLRVHPIAPSASPILRARYGATDEALFLIRPDGYVGASAAAMDELLVARYAERLELGRAPH